MHLAIISPYPPTITGIGQYGYHASRLLADCGEFSKITVLHGPAGAPGEGVDTARSPTPLAVQAGWRPGQWDTGGQIAARLRTLNPDMVWFNLGVSIFGKSPLGNLSGFLSVAWAHAIGLPTVVTLHELPELADLRALKAPGGAFSLHGARLLAWLATRADVVCLTMQRYVEWLTARRPGPRYLHIPTAAYHPPLRLPEPATPELLFFSTFAPFKGLETLLEAFGILRGEYPALRLTVAGARHMRFPDYPQQIRAAYAGLPGVNWLGQVAESEIRGLFQRAGVVVLPYLASTGSSSVLMQAAAWGRSMVVSDLDEIRSVVSDNGLDVTFFRRGQAAALAEALKAQLDSGAQRRSQVEHNLAALSRRGPEAMCQAYLQAFNLALEAKRSPKRIPIPQPLPPEYV